MRLVHSPGGRTHYCFVRIVPSDVQRRSIRHGFRRRADPRRLAFVETGSAEPGSAPDGKGADVRSQWEVENEERPLTPTETHFRALLRLLREVFLTYFRPR